MTAPINIASSRPSSAPPGGMSSDSFSPPKETFVQRRNARRGSLQFISGADDGDSVSQRSRSNSRQSSLNEDSPIFARARTLSEDIDFLGLDGEVEETIHRVRKVYTRSQGVETGEEVSSTTVRTVRRSSSATSQNNWRSGVHLNAESSLIPRLKDARSAGLGGRSNSIGVQSGRRESPVTEKRSASFNDRSLRPIDERTIDDGI